MKILLHVGMPKCGSSALQAFLSSSRFSEIGARQHGYAAIRNHSEPVIWGKELIRTAELRADSYCASLTDIRASQTVDPARIKASLKQLSQEHETLILSSEGWGQNAKQFFDDPSCIFNDDDFDVSVIAYVRPQLEWLNSAWWQWGAWSDIPFGEWVEQMKPAADWHRLMQQWEELPWVNSVNVRLLQGDVVQDFMKFIGYDLEPQPRHNQGMPETMLRLFQRNRALRPNMHDSAIEFILGKHLQLEAGKMPWVLGPKQIDGLIDFYMDDNLKLVEMLPDEMRETMREDPRWWSMAHYQGRVPAPIQAESLDSDDMEKYLVTALQTVVSLDREVRQLRRKMQGMRHNRNKE